MPVVLLCGRTVGFSVSVITVIEMSSRYGCKLKSVVCVSWVSVCMRGHLVSWCFKPSQPQRITSGLNVGEKEKIVCMWRAWVWVSMCMYSVCVSVSGGDRSRT